MVGWRTLFNGMFGIKLVVITDYEHERKTYRLKRKYECDHHYYVFINPNPYEDGTRDAEYSLLEEGKLKNSKLSENWPCNIFLSWEDYGA